MVQTMAIATIKAEALKPERQALVDPTVRDGFRARLEAMAAAGEITAADVDPLAERQFKAAQSAAIAAALNADTIDCPRLVTPADITRELQLRGKWARICRVARTALPFDAPGDQVEVVEAAIDMEQAMVTRRDFDLSVKSHRDAIVAGLERLKSGRMLDDEDIVAVIALGTGQTSWSKLNLGRDVEPGEVQRAME